MQNCAIDDVMMAHVAHKEHTMAPYATAATHADPMGPTAATCYVGGVHLGEGVQPGSSYWLSSK